MTQNNRDPFLINEPVCISFSGGRTSAYMLHRILEANHGIPEGSVVCFANTGKEEEATLKFVRDCEKNWNIPIVWLEYADNEEKFKVVNFETASRKGEPFELLIKQRKYLPNPVTRYCTAILKIRTMGRYLKSVGLADTVGEAEEISWMGIRADEQRRSAKIKDKSRVPLVSSGITKLDVSDFWRKQSFDLGLPNINGITYHGNCDLCFLKGANQTFRLIKEKPERATWWIKMEQEVNASTMSGNRFRMDRPSYLDMHNYAQSQDDMFSEETESIACFCGD